MTVASLRAVAVLAPAGPKRARMRRWYTPSHESVLPIEGAKLRNRSDARLFTPRVRLLSLLRPLTLLPGHKPSHEQKALTLRQWLTSTPISAMSMRTLRTLSPTMLVKSTPQMRFNSSVKSFLGALPAHRFFFFFGVLPSGLGGRCSSITTAGLAL